MTDSYSWPLTFDKTIMNSRSVIPVLAAIAAVALTTSSTLFARIGETEQECAARYGEPTKKRPKNSFPLSEIKPKHFYRFLQRTSRCYSL